jgi:hypothetical protein
MRNLLESYIGHLAQIQDELIKMKEKGENNEKAEEVFEFSSDTLSGL